MTKKLQSKLLALLVLASAVGFKSTALATSYQTNDVLLVFRSAGLNDVEFDLGNISQFLNHPNGYTVAVTNWNPAIVNANYPLNGGGVQFAVLATTSVSDANPESWVSDAQPLAAVTDPTPSTWKSGLAGKIGAMGVGTVSDPSAPAGTNYDSIAPTALYSFDFIASNSGKNPSAIPYLGGAAGIQFPVTATVPATVLFYGISPSSAPVKPAGTLVGSFALDTAGHLTFRAGPLLDSTQITSATAANQLVAVSFSSRPAVKYRLRYSTSLSVPLSAWTILPNPVAGDGTPQVLTDNSATNDVRFYEVESYP
jgi:hypothetical protein